MPLTLANMGIPMLAVHLPVLVVSLVPVVFIEAWWIGRATRIPFKKLGFPVFFANLISTLLGVPITWFILVILQISYGGGGVLHNPISQVTLQSPWLIPDEANIHWKIPLAALALCPVFFAVSAAVESLLLRHTFREHATARGGRTVWAANAITYALITAFWIWQYLTAKHA
ncbi:MAG: hypothetical protein IBJ18_00770 [Phycisphaerales bacterium]|nr:hypothetical protein [Phycisphaerales bacterium]